MKGSSVRMCWNLEGQRCTPLSWNRYGFQGGANEPNYKELFAICRESMDCIDKHYVPMTKYGFLSIKLWWHFANAISERMSSWDIYCIKYHTSIMKFLTNYKNRKCV